LPHRGFNQAAFRVEPLIVNVGDFARLDPSVVDITAEVLAVAGLIRHDGNFLKVLGDGEVTRAFNVTAVKFSESAKAKIEKAGGKAVIAQ
jgi:large subunit ribosomal protein L15